MTKKTSLTIITAGLLAAAVLCTPYAPSAAQGRAAITNELSAQQRQDNKGQSKKATPRSQTPRAGAQRNATSRVVRQPTTSHVVRQPKATSRIVRQPTATSRVVKQPKATSRVVRQPKATRKVVAPAATGRKVASPVGAPRVVTPRGKRTVTASRLRGVPGRGLRRTVIGGHNYSAWRSGHRVRHGSGWRTFVALSALGAIAIGSSEYYPYAYISAPENYCEGLTEDGCELMWQDVETIEGDVVPQCVAYCPWQ